jgi:FdrA protein
VLLIDVVLGHAAHPDPAADLAPAVEAAHAVAAADGRDLAVVISLVGTVGDPQGLDRQAETLQAAGASIHLSNAAAARKAVELVGG